MVEERDLAHEADMRELAIEQLRGDCYDEEAPEMVLDNDEWADFNKKPRQLR